MAVVVEGFEMAETVPEVEKLILDEKENGKIDQDDGHGHGHVEVIKFGSHGDEPVQGGGEKIASDAYFPKDALDDWGVKQIHTFYFVRHRPNEDPKIKAKINQLDKEVYKLNQARFQLIEDRKAKKAERGEILAQLTSLREDFRQCKSILDEKKKEMEPLKQALGNLRNTNGGGGGGRGSLCSSEEELNDLIYRLKYRMQHESIPLSEEKQILKEIKNLEGTREKVIANSAMRTKIQDSLGQKGAIQDQVKLMGADLDGVRKEQQAVQAKRTQLRDKAGEFDSKIEALENELDALTEKRDKAIKAIHELRKQRDEGNTHYYQSRSLINKAREIAAKKDTNALEELASEESEKFMALWNGNKSFRDDYEERILPSLDSRQMSRDGRIRNPGEKPLVAPVVPLPAVVEKVIKPVVKQPKEDNKPLQPDVKPVEEVQKEADKKVKESKSLVEDVEVEEYAISNLRKEPSADKEIDEAKLKETKKEEELAKAKQAMERKKKLAEKAASKAAIRVQKEAEKKLKEREKKAKKKAGASGSFAVLEEASESATEASEAEKAEENMEDSVPVPAPVTEKHKMPKGRASIRQRNRGKGPDALPKAVLKRKKATNYWLWAAPPAALMVVLLVVFGYMYLL